jgi:hypothetical protein
MLLSYSHKFIFIHVYKVAGMSIKKSLEEYAKRPVMRRFLRAIRLGSKVPYYRWKTFPSHIKAEDLRKELPEKIYSNFYKFAFVRNPWEWQVSLYHHMLQQKTHFQHTLIKSMKNFDEYIVWRVNEDKVLQKEFVTDSAGKMIVDFVGKFELLTKDFHHVCNVLNINASLPHINKSSHMHYQSYYNAETRRLVEENFSEDIELFDYAF